MQQVSMSPKDKETSVYTNVSVQTIACVLLKHVDIQTKFIKSINTITKQKHHFVLGLKIKTQT